MCQFKMVNTLGEFYDSKANILIGCQLIALYMWYANILVLKKREKYLLGEVWLCKVNYCSLKRERPDLYYHAYLEIYEFFSTNCNHDTLTKVPLFAKHFLAYHLNLIVI